MRHRTRLTWLASLAVALAPATLSAQIVLPRKHTPQPTVPAITVGDLMTRLYIFADDSMQGREAGTIGDVKGTNYIAAQYKAIGLVPAGDNGTYFQTVPYKTRTLDQAATKLTVNGAPLALGRDFIPSTRDPAALDGLAIVYGGTFGDSMHALTPAQANGKLVVLSVAAGTNRRALRGASVKGAAAVALIGLDRLPRAFRRFYARPSGFLDDPHAPGPHRVRTAVLISSAAAAKMFTQPIAQLSVGAGGGTASLHLSYTITPAPYPARNVIGILPGSDPTLKGEYVAVGAHNDHIGFNHNPVAEDSIRIWNHLVRPKGMDDRSNQATPAQQAKVDSMLAAYRKTHPNSARPDSIDNGADDDGSGTVSMLEIAQKLAAMQPRPKRSILFVSHVGEEKGLLGSHYFTDHPTVPRDSIVAQLNMDMVGRGDATDETAVAKNGTVRHGGPDYLMLVGSRRLSTELGDLVERVNTVDHHGLVFDYTYDENGHPANVYCRSDHYEYARYGIPIVFFTTGLHADYHQVSDEPEYIDYPHMAKVANFIADVTVHVADLDHRPVVDHPKPDPYGTCRQ